MLKLDIKERLLHDIDVDNKVIEQLDIGDIQILSANKIELIFERKTVSDLYGSIKDGRYHEQKSRLVSSLSRNRICYIIEDPITSSKFIDTNGVYGAIIHTMFRDNIFVYRSIDVNDTKSFIKHIYTRFTKNMVDWCSFLEKNSLDYCLNVNSDVYTKKSSKRSENITNDIVYLNMLKCIPGISTKKADALVKLYPNMNLLVNTDQTTLSNTKIDNRKLGDVLSKKIVEILGAKFG
jgi:crossover junction endonuclease MUS81